MIRKVLQAFADDNFGDNYYPLLHGTSSSNVKPFGLMIKQKRSIWKKPFKKSEFKIIAGLEYYVKEDKKEEFFERVNAKKQTQNDLEITDYNEDDEPPKSYMEFGVQVADIAEGNLKINYDLGELKLGKLDKEYFNDPDLHSILQGTELDTTAMERVENEKLYLIYSVIYSERFELEGKRQSEVVVDGGVNVPVSIIPQLKVKAKGYFKKKTVLPKAVKRHTRGPVYLKFVPVDYDKAQGKLKLPPGEFAGSSVHRAAGDEHDTENSQTALAFEDEDNNLAAPLTDEDSKKLDIIKEAILLKSEDREKRKERVKKYLKWFEEALTTEKMTLSLPDNKPLTDEDCDFLQSIYCQVLPGKIYTVDLSSLKTVEKIQGYAILLKLIDGLSDEQWEEIEKAWADPEQNE